MNENQNNQNQNFEPVVTEQKKSGKVKKFFKGLGFGLLTFGVGTIVGYFVHDQKCKNDGTYDDAQQTRDYRERKNNRNNS